MLVLPKKPTALHQSVFLGGDGIHMYGGDLPRLNTNPEFNLLGKNAYETGTG